MVESVSRQYVEQATHAEERDGVLGITAGLFPPEAMRTFSSTATPELLSVDTTCFPGFSFPAREGFALAYASLANSPGIGGKSYRGACRGVDVAGNRVADLEEEVVALRAAHTALQDNRHQVEEALTTLASTASTWQKDHRLPNSHQDAASCRDRKGNFKLPTNPIFALFPEYNRLAEEHKNIVRRIEECASRTYGLRRELAEAQREFIASVLAMERVEATVCRPRLIARRGPLNLDTSRPHERNPSEANPEPDHKEATTQLVEKARVTTKPNTKIFAPAIPLEVMHARVTAALRAIRETRQGKQRGRETRQGHVNKNLRRLLRDVSRIRRRKLGNSTALEASRDPAARAAAELERRMHERDVRAAQIVAKLQREREPRRPPARRKQRAPLKDVTRAPEIILTEDPAPREVTPPPPLPLPEPVMSRAFSRSRSRSFASSDAPRPSISTASGSRDEVVDAFDIAGVGKVQPPAPEPVVPAVPARRQLPRPQHIVSKREAVRLDTASFTPTPEVVEFHDYDREDGIAARAIQVTITNTSGLTNTVRIVRLDSVLSSRGVTAAWADGVPGRLSPGRASRLVVRLNAKIAASTADDKDTGADILGNLIMEAEIGGQFLVPIRAAAARAVLKVVSEDRVTCPPCVVGRKSTAGVRIVNRGALDATISVSCMTFADKVVVLAPSAEGLVPRLSDSRSSHEDGRKALGEEGFSESQENKAVDTSAEAFGSLMEHILVPGYGSALVPLQFEAHECGTHRGRVTFNSAGEHVGVVELVGEGQEPPLSIDPALSVGVVSTNAPRSIGVILRNRSQTCLHVHAVQPGRTPLAEVVISPATVAVHHGSFRVNVRVTALPAPSDIAGGAFSMPLRFFYDLDGARYHVETILEGTATRLTLLTPKVIRVPECTVWDKPVTVHLPIENKGAVPQRVHCQVSHVPTLRFGSAEEALDLGILGSSNGKTKSSSAHFVGKKSHSKLVKSTESLRTVEVLVPAGSTLPVPILFDPSNWKERTALFVTVRSDGAPAHHEHRISIEAEPKRPVLRVQESLVQAGAVARGSSGFATATLVRHRTVGEERHDVLDALRYSVGKNLGKGVRIEALDQHAEGDFPVGSLELQLRVFVTETAPSGSPCIVQVPVSFTRAGRPAGNVQIAVQVRPVAADISTANLALSAGPVPRGITSIVNIPIMNTSQTAVAVQVRRLEQKGEASFEVDPKTFEIAAGDTFSVPVRFTPETAEACSSSWEISTSTTQLPVTITGVGMIPLISWSADDETEPALLSFPDLLLGDLGTRNLLVRNKGVESVEVTVVVTDTSGTFALRKPLGSSTNVNVLPSPSTTTDPAESLGPETSQTLKILPNTTQTVQLVFCPTRESDHFSSTVEFSTIGLLPMTSRVVGRCWDTTTAVTGYDVQPPEMCDGPWDIPPAVFIEEDPEEEDETDEEDSVRESSLEDSDDDLYARVGPTIPHPTPSDSTEAPRPSLMQELDALRPVELECTQYGTLALKWQHAPGGGYVLGSRHLTLANLRPPVPRVEGVAPTGGGTGKQAAAAGGAHPKQPSAGASTSKRAAASKQPPAVPADFVIDSYEHSIAYYPALGIYHDAPAPQTFDSHLSIVLDASEGTVEPGGERRVRISVARPTAAASVPATTPSGASRASHPAAAATGARTDDDGKRLNSPPRKREISGGASIAVPPAAVGVATTSPDPAVEEPVRLEACYKITLNGGLKLGAVPMPATDNRVWIIRIVLDGVE